MIFSKDFAKELSPFVNTILICVAYTLWTIKDFFARLFK